MRGLVIQRPERLEKGAEQVNAKELSDQLRRDADHIESFHGAVNPTYLRAMADVAEMLVPKYRPPQPSDDGRYCFLEELPSDAPPTLVRIEPYIHDYPPHVWQYWTVAGWRELTQGVWPCERPEGGAE